MHDMRRKKNTVPTNLRKKNNETELLLTSANLASVTASK